MRVRQLRDPLRDWIGQRVKMWTMQIPIRRRRSSTTGQKRYADEGHRLRGFHNFLGSAMGQYALNIINDLRGDGGDPSVRSWFGRR